MKPEEIAALLVEKFGAKILESKGDGLLPFSVVEPAGLPAVCEFVRRDERMQMDHLECLSGVDYKDRIEVVYTFYSMKHRHRYTLKVRLPRENPAVHSVESFWGVANWHEREAFDMFGIVFEGHSDLRRILCPDDWEGHPLRKDYTFPKSYRDMPV
jgi:NADH-quinone oxidoreductase subunit C